MRVLIVDDHSIFRSGLRADLGEGLEVVGEAATVDEAVALIAELEPFDRGRYAGPVGWIDQDGDGEWVIALRCARIDDDGTLTAYAGAGIVADSDPESELAETRMKFRPIADALR